jgi:hypothetical protein
MMARAQSNPPKQNGAPKDAARNPAGLNLLRAGNEFHGVAECLNGFGSIIGDFDPEFFFECHYQFDGIKAVCTKIINEGRSLRHFVFFNTKMLYNDLAYAVGHIAHVNSSCLSGQLPVFIFPCGI